MFAVRWPAGKGGSIHSYLAAGLVVVGLLAAPAGAFNPQRQFPNTWDRIHVFVDQLPSSLSVAQRQFAASHYAGTQKQTSILVDLIRVYNPNFLHLQYRLGVRESGQSVNYIHNDTWSNDWANINSHEDWFVHDNQGNRVYQLYAGWLKEYCMDASGLIEGNTTYGWKEYWADAVISDAVASHADGVFADSTHLPYAVPSDLWDSPMGSPPHTAYIPHLEVFYDYVYQQLDAANIYFIPNIGGLITTVDTTTGYYTDVHGAMVEGFGTTYSDFDWRQQMNRTLNLIRNGKIFIAQNGFGDPSNIEGRLWLLGNFLLVKHDKSFINMLANGVSQMHWWPEYDLDLGAPVSSDVPSNISDLLVTGGLYARRFERGLVLVNGSSSSTPKTYTLGPDDPHMLVRPYGGGEVSSDGTWSGGIDLVDAGGSVTLGPWSAAILLQTEFAPGDCNRDGVVDEADLAIWLANYKQTGGWDEGDFNGDGFVNGADYTIWADNYSGVGAVPEPMSLALLAAGGAAVLLRRRS